MQVDERGGTLKKVVKNKEGEKMWMKSSRGNAVGPDLPPSPPVGAGWKMRWLTCLI